MEVFRLSKETHAADLSGIGASIRGGRWNSPGTKIIYTASNRSLAMAEILVHLSIATIPSDYRMTTILIPDDVSMKTLQVNDLPSNWNTDVYAHGTQMVGDEFIRENVFCFLRVPSAVTKGDFNILINPNHVGVQRIKILSIDPFPFDRRIFKS